MKTTTIIKVDDEDDHDVGCSGWKFHCTLQEGSVRVTEKKKQVGQRQLDNISIWTSSFCLVVCIHNGSCMGHRLQQCIQQLQYHFFHSHLYNIPLPTLCTCVEHMTDRVLLECRHLLPQIPWSISVVVWKCYVYYWDVQFLQYMERAYLTSSAWRNSRERPNSETARTTMQEYIYPSTAKKKSKPFSIRYFFYSPQWESQGEYFYCLDSEENYTSLLRVAKTNSWKTNWPNVSKRSKRIY